MKRTQEDQAGATAGEGPGQQVGGARKGGTHPGDGGSCESHSLADLPINTQILLPPAGPCHVQSVPFPWRSGRPLADPA